MKMVFPDAASRARILQGLYAFYETEKRIHLRTALAEWAAFYHVKAPVVELRRLKKEGKEFVLGRTHIDNRVQLWPPAAWKSQEQDRPVARRQGSRRKMVFSAAEYVATVLHELAHVLYYVEAERKADLYARRFVRSPQQGTQP